MATANKKKEILWRAYFGFLFVCLLGIAIVSRAFYIQTVEGNYYRSMFDSLTITTEKIAGDMGNIYSEDGALLATTIPMFDIRIDFKTTRAFKDAYKTGLDSVALLLSQTFGDKSKDQYKREISAQYNKKSRYYLLKRNVNLTQMNQMRKWPWFREGKYKSGMVAVQNNKRMMPFGQLAQRTIGFTNDNGKAVGLEGKYNDRLTGEKGEVVVQKIAGGIRIPIDSKEDIAPQPGKDIYTTIDVNLQDVAEDALYRALNHHKAEHGCVILMETKTGKIKAIANLGVTKDSTYAEVFNYAVGESTEPGSTFKLATCAALMEDGLVNNNTMIDMQNGVAQFYNLTIKDHEAPETPEMSLKRAIEVSSNVAMAKLAFANYSAKPEKFYNHLKDFGFTQPIEIELAGAGKPVLAEPKKWSGVSTAYLAHGYEIQITPLHTLTFYNAIANNGVMVKPYLVNKVKEYNKTIDSTTTTVLKEKLFSERTIKDLRAMLEGVVQNGTATNLKTDYLKVAGKTGTAVIAQGNQGYKKRIYQASFCGYFPADEPQYSMIVVINSPSTNGYYGNVVAGAIFKEVADKVYSLSLDMHNSVNKGVTADKLPVIKKGDSEDISRIYSYLGAVANGDGSEWVQVAMNGKTPELIAENTTPGLVPDVTGMSLKDALFLLEGMGLHVRISGMGNVKTQSIAAGTKITKGTQIIIELS
jgi:cell division protein FtsI (penicillin-binding protein 3)